MIQPFSFFIIRKKVKRVTPSKETANELLASAKIFLKLCESARLTDELASPILVNAYESAREASQSLMALAGYKPYSHEAVVSFLAENVKTLNTAEINKLDNIRVLRNEIVYKAERVSKIDAQEAIELAKEIIRKIEALHNE